MAIKEFAERLLRYDNWQNFINHGVCEYCGKHGLGQLHNIDRMLLAVPKVNSEIKKNLDETSYRDPKAKYHKHGSLIEKMTRNNVDPLFIEWVYVIDPEKKTIKVLTRKKIENVRIKNGKEYYSYFSIGEWDLTGFEPDWNKLEEIVND